VPPSVAQRPFSDKHFAFIVDPPRFATVGVDQPAQLVITQRMQVDRAIVDPLFHCRCSLCANSSMVPSPEG
jgi:hypothetical protein